MVRNMLDSCRRTNGRTRRTSNAASASTDIAPPAAPRFRPKRQVENPAISSSPISASTADFFHIGHADRSQQIVRIPHVRRLCQECEQPIPEFKKLRAKQYNSTALYCSNACQTRAQAKRKPFAINSKMRTLKAAAPRTTECCTSSAIHGAGADPPRTW